ncbi:MAG: RNA-guided endonuclease TnpB family protein [Candidatus Baltobacteraceae bacterium]|jgi:putative transposase
MILAHRIRLVPSGSQSAYFTRACGVARFAYNWALAEWQRQYDAGEKPSEVALRKQLNALKSEQFPWMREVTKCAPQHAIKNLGRAYGNFFDDVAKYRRAEIPWKRVRTPRFKRKGVHDSFRADNGPDQQHPNAVKVDGKRVKLPIAGWVKMREEVRFTGRILSVTISRRADGWYASFAVEVRHEPPVRSDVSVVGVDLGITSLATLSDGSPKIPSPKPLRRYLQKLKHLSRDLTRKQRGSRNRAKAKTKLARLHRRIADIRGDALHKLTTSLMRYRTIAIEDLNVCGMLANRCLSRAIGDLGFFEFRRQLEYKAAMAGSSVIVAARWYPSSRLCSSCAAKNETLALSERLWTCASCGTSHDRDHNAAVNLARYAESSAASACGAAGSGGEDHLAVKPAA